MLSDALDLVGVDDVLHGKRVAWLARNIVQGEADDALVRDAHNVSLVHDCGVSSTSHHQRLVAEVTTADDHSAAGARLLGRFGPLAHLADVVHYHHTPWPQLTGVEPRTARLANLVFLADRIDVLQAKAAPATAAELRRLVEDRLLGPWAHLFADDLMDAARGVLADDETLDVLRSSCRELFLYPGEDQTHQLTSTEARGLALLFAQAVDGKSAFTARHSSGVAAVSLYLAEASGQLRSSPAALEIAALLHDLGKLRVPDEVLDKPGALSPAERDVIRAHAGESRDILGRITGFDDIASIAGMHHEFLDGTGYPLGLVAEQIPFEAQVVTVADIFQALAQDRPYRRAMALGDVLAVLDELAGSGKVNASLVRILREDSAKAWALARIGER